MAYAVAIVGALTTIATSAPRNHTIDAIEARTFEPGERVHVVVRASRRAIDHADRGEVVFVARDREDPQFVVTPDDAGLATGPTSFRGGFTSVQLDDPGEICPGDDVCEIGIDVVLDPAAATLRSLEVHAILERFADGTFLLPEDRSFPEGAPIEVSFE